MPSAHARLVLCVFVGSTIQSCHDGDAAALHERRALVQGFDAIMQAGEGRREAPLEAFRELELHGRGTRRTRATCLVMFDAVARAASLQTRLEPLSAEAARQADAGVEIPPERREAMLVLYREAVRATDEASRRLRPCTQGIDRIRAHPDRAE